MGIVGCAAGGSRLFTVGLCGLLLASGCRSSTSTSEPTGKVEHAPENAPVTLNHGPSTLDSFGVDSGASCSDAGPPSTGLDGGASCGATLAASTFQYAICSCGSLQSTGVLTTDGYDSTKGGPTGALGANVGFNASAAWSSAPSLGGNLFSPGGISAPKGGLVRGDLHLGGSVQGGGQTFTVDGNAFVEATLPSSVKVVGTTSHVSSVASPCSCGSPLPTTSLVTAHQAPNNEDSAIGLSPSAAGGGNPSQIDLPCGDFYLTVISPSKPLTIAAHGHTELYIGGAVSTSNALTFSIDPGASLDLFVAGGFSATGALNLGSVSSPSSCRVYVAGSQFQVPSSASIACNIYAPSASIGLPSTTAYGSIFAAGVTASGSATLHYDTSIQSGTCATCTAASCDDGNPCSIDTCNSNGICSHTNVANGTSCPTGANLCDQSYTCQAGVCTGINPVTCTAQDQCHGIGTCNAATGTCSNPALANGTTCNDGNACTQVDSCSSGVCTGSSPVVCTAENQCHSVGVCAPATGVCSNPALANGTACNDGNACTLSDSCQSGSCVGSSPVTCVAADQCHVAGVCNPTSGTCSTPAAPNGTACNDGNTCTQLDSCQLGVCTGSSAVVCTASDQCHAAGACNPSTGACSNPAAANGTTCNDGNACTQSDSCQSGTCVGSNPVTCTASDACHAAGTCSPSTGTCSNPSSPDGTACTGANKCQTYACAGGTCVGGNTVVCTASGSCQLAGSCDPTTGACSTSAAPNGTSCNDGNACTANDVCTGGTCSGTPLTCTASGPCTLAGTCNPATGVCSSSNAPDGTACNDNNACTQTDSCVEGTCTGTNPVVCAPAGLCQASATCDPATGQCSGPPRSQCPAVNQTVASTIFGTTAFLYSGANPSQTGVTPGTIVPQRAVILRGRTLDTSSNPISGASVTVLGHPEFGATTTMSDGTYTMAVNGGGPLTVSLTAGGYLPVQRTLPTPWNDYAVVADVVLTALDAASTSINLASPTDYQVARATTITDSDGSRTATLLVPPGTQAVLNTGTSSVPVTTLRVRATEYTVGTTGPLAMPGNLPANSGYTYAVEFSADEALAQGAAVQFSSPIVSYTDNFLSFTAGEHVPVGYYDRTQAQWIPSPDGLVIAIVSVTGGVANIDVTGDGVADPPATLATLGITAGEQAQLGAIYIAPTSLWRVSIPHFSPWDYNWPFGPPPDAVPPNPTPPGPPPVPPSACGGLNDDSNSLNASRIECQNGILHEAVPIPGTAFSLTYASDRVAGYGAYNHLLIPLSGAALPSDMLQIDLEVDIVGRQFLASFPPSPNLNTTFDWDGNDVFGRALQGLQTAKVSIGYVYPGVYLTPSENAAIQASTALFGHFSYFGTPATGDRTRQQVTLWQYATAPLGHWAVEPMGLGGWGLEAQAAYDPGGKVLHMGDGTNATAASLPGVVQTVVASGPPVGGLGRILAIGPDGSYYMNVDDSGVERIQPDGTVQTLAAQATYFSTPRAGALALDGSLYVADSSASTVSRIAPNGVITVVAGNGTLGFSGDGGPATSASLWSPNGLVVGPDGSIYIADTGNNRVREVSPDGVINTVVFNGGYTQCCSGPPPPSPATSVPVNLTLESVRLGPDGSLYVVEQGMVQRVTPDGLIRPFAGNGQLDLVGYAGEGGLATAATLTGLTDCAVAADGTVYFNANEGVREVTPDGLIRTVAGLPSGYANGPYPLPDGSPAISTGVLVIGLGLGPDGLAYFVDGGEGQALRRVEPPLPGLSALTDNYVMSALDGRSVYTFNGLGAHMETTDPITGATLYSFGYDSVGQIVSITDVNGDVTTIGRDDAGNPTSVVSPFGVTTTLQIGSDGYLAAIADPTGTTHQMTYSSGLLTGIVFPNGFASTKTYDALGRVATSTDAAGGQLTFNRDPDSVSSVGVTKTTSLGVTTHYRVSVGPSGSSSWSNSLPGNLTATQQIGTNASRTATSPDGTQTSTTFAPDPRFGMIAPIASNVSVSLPSGLTSTTTMTRSIVTGTGAAPLAAQTDTINVNGNTWTRAFNAGPPVTWTTTSPVGRVTQTTVDFAGRPLQISLNATPPVAPLSFLYDSHGRLQQTTQGTRIWTTGYDANGYANSQTDPLTHTVSTSNDLDGRPLFTTLPDQREVGTTWDGDSNMSSITLPGALATQPDPTRKHQFSYTPVDLTQSYTPPAIATGLPSTSYSYDLDRFLTTIARPDGIVVTHVPDSFERLSQITYPQGTVGYAYNSSTGQLQSTTAPSGETTTFRYDGFLQNSTTWSGPVAGSITFGYNADFRVISQSLNGGPDLSFAYDDDGLLNLAGALTIVPDPQNGRLSATTLGAVADAYGYDTNGLMASYAATYGGNVVYTETIVSRDLNGRITEKTEALGGPTHDWKYVYDPAGRLTDVTEDGNFEAHYGYDGDDNRTTFTSASGIVNPTYDVQDRLSAYGTATYALTRNGELVSKTISGQVTSYTYDALGNLLSVGLPAPLADGAQTIGYIVDGQNRRVGRSVNGTLVQGWLYQDQLRPVAQLDGSGTNVVARFVYGSKSNVPDYMVTSGGTYRILSDHLGSPRLVVDANSGAVIETINFDEFGNETDTLAGTLPTGYVRIPFGFAGGLYDPDTGLVRFGARDYDASVGRWTSKDPTRFGGGLINVYGYVGNDPIDHVDTGGTGPLTSLAVEAACQAYAAYQFYVSSKQLAALADQIASLRDQIGNAEDQMMCNKEPTSDPSALQQEINQLLAEYANQQAASSAAFAAQEVICAALGAAALAAPTP